ncbi:MAG: hypothetical protein HQM03_19515 [Magnetococcales bacterium]|nr:hypothetical protein [Magnetococcales bacterium]
MPAASGGGMDHKSLLLRLWRSPYLWQSGGYVGVQMVMQAVLGTLQVWALANHLPREGYGVWGYCAALAGIVTVFTLPGMGQVITYGAARGMDGVLWAGVKIRLTFGLLSSLALFGMAGAHLYTGERQSAGLLFLAGLFLPSQMAFDSVEPFLTGQGRFRALFWRRLIAQGSIAMAIWIGAAWTGSLWVCGLIMHGGGFLISLLLFKNLLRYRRNTLLPDDFAGLSRQFSLQSIGNAIGYNMERPLLAGLVGFEAMAAYNLALAAQLPVGMGRLVDRIVVSRLANRELGVSPAQVRWGMWMLFGLGGAGYLMLVQLIRWLVPWILPGYLDAILLIEILLLQMPFTWANSLGMSWLLARPENHAWYHRVTWVVLVARIVSIVAGALLGGIPGVCWAWVVLEACQFGVTQGMILRRTGDAR